MKSEVDRRVGGNSAAVVSEPSSIVPTPRSPIFMLLVLAHGFRRLLPPY